MTLLLVLIFIVIPIAELYVLVQVSQGLGVGNALGLLVVISIAGAWLTKRAGLGVLRRLRSTVDAGRVPSAEVVEGFLVLLAGALLLTPGFLTDGVGILLLLPPTRAAVRVGLVRMFRSRAQVFVTGGRAAGTVFGSRGRHPGEAWDTESWEAGAEPPPPDDRGPRPGGPDRGELEP